MDEKCGYKTPTPADSLEQQIIDPSFPKNEREWWASEEITRLRAEVQSLRAENARLRTANERMRAALERFRCRDWTPDWVRDIANRALEGGE